MCKCGAIYRVQVTKKLNIKTPKPHTYNSFGLATGDFQLRFVLPIHALNPFH